MPSSRCQRKSRVKLGSTSSVIEIIPLSLTTILPCSNNCHTSPGSNHHLHIQRRPSLPHQVSPTTPHPHPSPRYPKHHTPLLALSQTCQTLSASRRVARVGMCFTTVAVNQMFIKFHPLCGFNPYEKYQSNWIISPGRDENKNIWNHHLVMGSTNAPVFRLMLVWMFFLYLPWQRCIDVRNDVLGKTPAETCGGNAWFLKYHLWLQEEHKIYINL